MNVPLPAVGAGLTGKNDNFLFRPLLEPRENG